MTFTVTGTAAGATAGRVVFAFLLCADGMGGFAPLQLGYMVMLLPNVWKLKQARKMPSFSFKYVLVDHGGHSAASGLLHTTHYASVALHMDIHWSAQHCGWHYDVKVDF